MENSTSEEESVLDKDIAQLQTTVRRQRESYTCSNIERVRSGSGIASKP